MTEPSPQSLAEDASSGDCPKTDMALLSRQGRTSESQELLWIWEKDLGAKLKRFSQATHKTNPVSRRVKVMMDGNPSNMFKCSIRALENQLLSEVDRKLTYYFKILRINEGGRRHSALCLRKLEYGNWMPSFCGLLVTLEPFSFPPDPTFGLLHRDLPSWCL